MRHRYLGIDYGKARIGLALSEAGLIARPYKTIENKGARKNLAALAEITKQNNIDIIVIGLPEHKNMAMADEVKAFAESIKGLGIQTAFQNEMLSSVEAEEYIRNHMGILDREKVTKLVDSVAASMILNDYLKKEKK